jgi:hypothetical protein
VAGDARSEVEESVLFRVVFDGDDTLASAGKGAEVEVALLLDARRLPGRVV